MRKYTFGYSLNMQYNDFDIDDAITQFGIFGWPIILTGYDTNGLGGHTWVADGYRQLRYTFIHNPGTPYEYESYTFSNKYIHMNWGWNQDTSNTWYYNGVPDVGWANFSNQYKMLIYIHPQN